MELSQRSLSAAIAVVFLFLLAMAIDVTHVQADQYCYYLSGIFHGWCLLNLECARTCRKEESPQRPGNDYVDGTCMDFPNRKCYCAEPCLKKKPSEFTAPAAGLGQGAEGSTAHHGIDNTAWHL